MTALREMPNIGKICASELEAVGIKDGEALKAAGAVGAAIRLRAAGFDVCRTKLSSLEGALRGIKWNLVSPETRDALWESLESLCTESLR